MKILHIIDKLDYGGAQILLKDIVENSSSRNTNINVFSLRTVCTTFKIHYSNVRISKSSFRFSLKPIFELFKYLRENEVDIIHTHLIKSNLIGLFLALFYKSKFCFIVHEHGAIFRKSKFSLYCLLMKFFNNNITRFVVVSKATKNQMISKCGIPSDKISILYNPLNPKRFKKINSHLVNKLKIKYKLKNHIVVGFTGRFHPIKGIIYLLKAFRRLYAENKNVRLVIIGDGPQKDILKEYVKKEHLSSVVIFTGFKRDIKNYIPLFDVAVIPSISESLGIVALEFMHCEIPIIASKVGGLSEILYNNKTTLFVKPGNVHNLYSKIKQLIYNKNLQKKLINNSKIVVKRYYVDKYIKKLNNLYSDLLTK